MNRKEIGSEIRELGLTWQDVADLCKKSRSFVQEVAAGNKTSHEVQVKIAAVINKDYQEVFPERISVAKSERKAKKAKAIQDAKARIDNLNS
ncbi:MAG: hypothetical protein ACJA0H_001093 [Francisellaceae bacterium]|jgi:hypothetical protein